MADTLFPEITDATFPQKQRAGPCTAGKCGNGPAGETCGTCRHIVRVQLNSKTIFKCGLMRQFWTGGLGTDIRYRWAACEKFEKAVAKQ